ncbi:MAG: hypothetical protein H7838_04400 [Magnetococcus sp. DMHC-8]
MKKTAVVLSVVGLLGIASLLAPNDSEAWWGPYGGYPYYGGYPGWGGYSPYYGGYPGWGGYYPYGGYPYYGGGYPGGWGGRWMPWNWW